jgi:hypothetical protein
MRQDPARYAYVWPLTRGTSARTSPIIYSSLRTGNVGKSIFQFASSRSAPSACHAKATANFYPLGKLKFTQPATLSRAWLILLILSCSLFNSRTLSEGPRTASSSNKIRKYTFALTTEISLTNQFDQSV